MQTKRQIQIVESSIKLIATNGIQRFTIKNLSKAIGISEPKIYRHFKNEEILINKIVEILNLHQASIEKNIEIGQKDKNIRTDIDKSNLALIFMGSFRLLVKRRELNNHNFNLKQEEEKLINSLKLIV